MVVAVACKCAKYDPEEGRYSCSVSGDGCMYLIPNSKRCAIEYDEGPDSDRNRDELICELKAEQKEYESIKDTYDDDNYDDVWDGGSGE